MGDVSANNCTGSETVYTMADAALGAFSVFFTHSPTFYPRYYDHIAATGFCPAFGAYQTRFRPALRIAE